MSASVGGSSSQKPDAAGPLAASSGSSPAPSDANSEIIQPGQLVQPAFSSKGKVELVSVRRTQNPQSGKPDVVNVQFLIHRLAAEVEGNDNISAENVRARNPKTSATYLPLNPTVDFTKVMFLDEVPPGGSMGAYVLWRVPAGVDTLDINIPKAKTFKDVPVSP